MSAKSSSKSGQRIRAMVAFRALQRRQMVDRFQRVAFLAGPRLLLRETESSLSGAEALSPPHS